MNARLESFAKIRAAVDSASRLLGEGNAEEALALIRENVSQFPYSTELGLWELRLMLLSETPIDSFEGVGRAYEAVLSCRGGGDLSVLEDLAAFRHRVLDEKSDDLDRLFSLGDELLRKNAASFLSVYFEYLSEKGDEARAERIKEEYVSLLAKIQENPYG